MKRNAFLIISLALFSVITGYLLSAISFVGRAGISLFYSQYGFLKTWWKGAILIYIVWTVLFVVQSLLFERLSKKRSNIVLTVSLLTAVAGLYFSYADFRNTLSHRWMGEPFHLGVYLFWLGWIAITIYIFLKQRPRSVNAVAVEDEKEH